MDNGIRTERPHKKIKALLEDDESYADERCTSSIATGIPITEDASQANGDGFTVNQEFARRFEHNKKREELQKLEGIYGSGESSTDSEDEDDEGVLASKVLDAQITDTLEAIRRKDPRVYDHTVKFYTDPEEEAQIVLDGTVKKAKPMYLSDYHRNNLLEGSATDSEADGAPATYAQQQDDLKTDIVKEMHAVANGDEHIGDIQYDEGESDDVFLVKKPTTLIDQVRPRQRKRKQQDLDVETAERDPETYLSNFMSVRAWVPSDNSGLQPFESDDEEEERRAEAFEEAYNLRFENSETVNGKLLSHARDAAAKYSVRKEEMNPRKKAREIERAKKDAARKSREEEKARMRKLKVAEAEEKINKIKEAAGLRGESLQEEDWSAFLEEGWDHARWEQEMKKRFGDDYYADHDLGTDTNGKITGRRKLKKPRWQDDLEIGDLVPDFDMTENGKPQFISTDDESDSGGALIVDTVLGGLTGHPDEDTNAKKKANKKREGSEQKKSARKERQKLERLVEQEMNVDDTLSSFSKKHAGHFRYRDTSPTAYGLTAQDILLASDSQLNQFTGLKKLATFRDPDKKRKDKKHLSKKARLRQWRKDTFGNEHGPQTKLGDVPAEQDGPEEMTKVKMVDRVDPNMEKNGKTRSNRSKARSKPG